MALPRFRKSAFEMVFELLLLPQLVSANVHIAAMTKGVGTARVMKASTGVVETRESLTLALTDPQGPDLGLPAVGDRACDRGAHRQDSSFFAEAPFSLPLSTIVPLSRALSCVLRR